MTFICSQTIIRMAITLWYNYYVLTIKNTSKKFGDKIAVDNLSLTIKEGEIFGLLGPNGAGKSTTIKMIVGILKPTEGDIFIDDYSIIKNSFEAKKLIGFVPDTPDMFLGLRGIDYLNFITSIYELNKDQAAKDIKDLASALDLYNDLNSFISEYSHGMRQKIFIIGALLHNPKYLILDEPLTGLDPSSSHLIKDIMKITTSKGNSVLYSTHVLDVAEKICDRVGIIDKGTLLFAGSLDELKKKENKDSDLENLFLQLTK